jgi:hypothetical protein
MSGSRIDRAEMISGIVVLLIGVGALAESSRYGLGSLASIGPGFFPLALSVVLVSCGIGTCALSFRGAAPAPQIKWRPLAAVAAAILAFALLARPFGLVPATIAATFAARFAEQGFAFWSVLALAGFLAAAAWVIFVLGLGLPLQTLTWPASWK